MRTLLVLSLAFIGLLSTSGEDGPAASDPRAAALATADGYIDAYERLDLDAMGAWLDERSTFQDPTTAEIAPAGLALRGREAIVGGLRAALEGLRDVRLDYGERFHSGGLVVAIGRLAYRIPAASLGPGASDATFDVRVVTVLRIVDGKVREHTDYTDLSGWHDTVAAAQR